MTRANAAAGKRRVRPQSTEQQINFDELPTYVGYQIRRAQSKIFGEFEAKLGDLGLTLGAFGVLTLVRANPGITQIALAYAFGVDKSTMSPVIFRLEKAGLLRREVVARDRRYQALYFEPSAEDYYLSVRDRIRAFERDLAARLTRGEQRQLSMLLKKLQGAGD
jgi:DNA-binding MarR family transcriptional regulator